MSQYISLTGTTLYTANEMATRLNKLNSGLAKFDDHTAIEHYIDRQWTITFNDTNQFDPDGFLARLSALGAGTHTVTFVYNGVEYTNLSKANTSTLKFNSFTAYTNGTWYPSGSDKTIVVTSYDQDDAALVEFLFSATASDQNKNTVEEYYSDDSYVEYVQVPSESSYAMQITNYLQAKSYYDDVVGDRDNMDNHSQLYGDFIEKLSLLDVKLNEWLANHKDIFNPSPLA